jgi:Protein of unknown function (DUF1353)
LKIRNSHFLALAFVIFGCVPMGAPLAHSQPAGKHQPARGPIIDPKPAAPEMKRLKNGHYYIRKPWTVELNGHRWVVPRGYSSNGITAPAMFKKSLGDGVEHPETWAAVFHDWLFTQPGISRAQADQTFLDLLLAYGVPAQKARLMFNTVSAYSLSKAVR